MFQISEIYSRRDDIHAVFGGQQQGGISTPKNCEFIFLFTGTSGEHYGYEDGWNEGGVFLYTGEGQKGDMSFRAGNRAIRDAAKDGKQILLFQTTGKGRPVRFLGSFACASWGFIDTDDVDGHRRQAIQFHLVPENAGPVLEESQEIEQTHKVSLDELRRRAFEAGAAANNKDWKQATKKYKARSKAVRDYVLARAAGKCELTGQNAPFINSAGLPYLEVHHTRRLSDDGPDDPRWVAAIHPVVHREIHFGENGKSLNERLTKMLKEIEP